MLPLSEKRLRANRANAAKSTGPVTPAGKARSSRNALRHGLLAKQILVGKESPESFTELLSILTARFEPIDEFEFGLIEELAASYWRLRRAWAVETEMLDTAMAQHPQRRQLARMAAAYGDLAADQRLNLLHRYESRLHMMYQRALHNLLLLRQFQPSPDALPNTNEPKTPRALNKSPRRTRSKTSENASKPPETTSKLHVPGDPNSSKGPSHPHPSPSSKILELSDIIRS